jgi:NAD(P)-dependent dehydrogenase (short-subunit alcohol dehydrogenase family)
MDYGLSRRVAVITGAGGAILGTVARFMAAEGARIAVWDLSAERAALTAGEIRASGGDAIGVTCDVTSQRSIVDALQQTNDTYGAIDVLVNGAGGSRPQTTTSDQLSFFDMVPEDIRAVMDLNYLSTVLCCRNIGRQMAEQKRGAIVNVTSVAGGTPLTRALAYCNGKAAANSFTQWLAVHMAQNYSTEIRVNAVAPGFVLTDQNRFLLQNPETGEPSDRGVQIMKAVPAGRYGTAEEIAHVVVFLASPLSSFIHGAVIPVDGGFTAFSGV